MSSWTHLIRFEAVEDGRVHLGQLVDTSRDIGLDSVEGTPIKAYRLNGDAFNGAVTKQVLTVSKVSHARLLSFYRCVILLNTNMRSSCPLFPKNNAIIFGAWG